MKKYTVGILGGCWLATVCAGLGILSAYDFTPGRNLETPKHWPAQSSLAHPRDLPTLIMVAHPNCPCTRASIGELAILMTDCQNLVQARVVFIQPKGTGDDWLHTDLWRSAEAIPGVTVVTDREGVEARLFEATTSGQVVLYDADGKLAFSGGITSSRGHAGDNPGRSTVTKILHRERTAGAATPVFGCPIFNMESKCSDTGVLCQR